MDNLLRMSILEHLTDLHQQAERYLQGWNMVAEVEPMTQRST